MPGEWAISFTQAILGEAEGGNTVSFLGEQLVVIATIIATIAALPELIEFLVARRKSKERIALSLDYGPPPTTPVVLAGLEDLEAGIADLVDCARNPADYRYGNRDNEILIIGRTQSGRSSLAQRFAQRAELDRVLTVYNARDVEVLSEAKRLLGKHRQERILLLLPDLDDAFNREDDDLHAELIALIESASGQDRVTVVATATDFEPDSDLDNLFAIKLVMPGTFLEEITVRGHDQETRRIHRAVATHYLDKALAAGLTLAGLDHAQVVERIVDQASNPGEIRDILNLALVAGTWHQRQTRGPAPILNSDTLEKSLSRVVVNASAKRGKGGSAG